MELWDVLDGERRPLGRVHGRGAAMPAGEYHGVVEIWTFSPGGRSS